MQPSIIQQLSDVTWEQGSKNHLAKWRSLGIDHGFHVDAADYPKHVHAKQVHGNRIIAAEAAQDSNQEATIEADGIYCSKRTRSQEEPISIGVKTADCLPVLIYSPELIMAVHGGWRGLAQGIMSEALAQFSQSMESLESLYIGLGPCISPHRFEVGPEVIAAFEVFVANDDRMPPNCLGFCLQKAEGDRWKFDLQTFALLQCFSWGVHGKQCTVLRNCTFDHPDFWPSYRRDSQSKTQSSSQGIQVGRIISWLRF